MFSENYLICHITLNYRAASGNPPLPSEELEFPQVKNAGMASQSVGDLTDIGSAYAIWHQQLRTCRKCPVSAILCDKRHKR
tara:strand:- start:1258 stop:1500 length:243 start_codon:yes stop_codon:yes gene_type:complete